MRIAPSLGRGESGSATTTGATGFFFAVAGLMIFFAFFPELNPMVRRGGEEKAPSAPVALKAAPVKPPEPAAPPLAAAPIATPEPEKPAPNPPAPKPERPARPVAETAPAPAPASASASRPRPLPAETAPKPERKGGGTGFLNVDATPWAEVSVDAVAVDRTPIASLPLTAGMHSVELANGEMGIKVTRKVKIIAGTTATLKVNLEAEVAKESAPPAAEEAELGEDPY